MTLLIVIFSMIYGAIAAYLFYGQQQEVHINRAFGWPDKITFGQWLCIIFWPIALILLAIDVVWRIARKGGL